METTTMTIKLRNEHQLCKHYASPSHLLNTTSRRDYYRLYEIIQLSHGVLTPVDIIMLQAGNAFPRSVIRLYTCANTNYPRFEYLAWDKNEVDNWFKTHFVNG